MKNVKVLTLLSAIMGTTAKTDSHPECADWAKQGECRKNPGFMLEGCGVACVRELEFDHDERCQQWANEGECTKNPGYMQLSCSNSCGVSTLWSPLTRSALNLPHHEERHEHNDIIHHTDNIALDSTLKMGSRIRLLFNDNIDTFSLSTDPWMLSAALGEAMLYTVNSAVLASRGIIDDDDGHSFTHGEDIKSNALKITKDISLMIEAGPDMFHRNAFRLWQLIDNDILHSFINAIASIGPEKCSAQALYDLEPSHTHIKEQYHPSMNLPMIVQGEEKKDKIVPSSATVTLRGGGTMPAIGFGTCWLSPLETRSAVLQALKNGVRHIDTAEAYRNEEAIGQAIVESGVPRSEIFLATKISQGESHGYVQTLELVKKQLTELQTNYIDLYYIHGYPQPPHDQRFGDTWRALEELVESGVIRYLGVSNYNQHQIRAMFEGYKAKIFNIKPSVIQNKFEPFHQGDQLNREGVDLVALASHYQIAMVGYSTLRGWPLSIAAEQDPHVEAIAERIGRSPAQILLRWALQSGVSVIPRSRSVRHIQQNSNILDFELTVNDMRTINALEHLVTSPLSQPRRPENDNFGLQLL